MLLLHSHHTMILLWIGIIIIVYLLFKILDSTDVSKIYGPRIAKKFGPVFQNPHE